MGFSFILQVACCCVITQHCAAGTDFMRELGRTSLSSGCFFVLMGMLLPTEGDHKFTVHPFSSASHVGRVWVISSAGAALLRAPLMRSQRAQQQEQDWGHGCPRTEAGRATSAAQALLVIAVYGPRVALLYPGITHVVCSCRAGSAL